jgi:hypothetical protein
MDVDTIMTIPPPDSEPRSSGSPSQSSSPRRRPFWGSGVVISGLGVASMLALFV